MHSTVTRAQSRLLVEEWEKMERLQKELEATKVELVKVKSETVRLGRTQARPRPRLHRARSWGENIDAEDPETDLSSMENGLYPNRLNASNRATIKDILKMDFNNEDIIYNDYNDSE